MDKSDIYHAPNQNCHAWNRSLCSVLDEMRACYKTRNFAPLLSLIEEAQTYANRMEAKLTDIDDYNTLKKRFIKLQDKVNVLKGSEDEE